MSERSFEEIVRRIVGVQLSEEELLVKRMQERWLPEWGTASIIIRDYKIVGLGPPPKNGEEATIYVSAEDCR